MNTSLIAFFGDILFINRMSQGFLNAAPVCLPNYLGNAFTPYLGKMSNLTNIFQTGWHLQPVMTFLCPDCCILCSQDGVGWHVVPGLGVQVG